MIRHSGSQNLYKEIQKIADLTSLLKETEKLGILNIDVTGDYLSPEVIQNAIEATKQLNTRLDKDIIARKLQKADKVAAPQYR
jgi:hypothetical protein